MRAFDAADTFAPRGGFDRILIPHSGIYCLPDDAACVACFQCCAEQLAEGGRLVFDAYAATADERPGKALGRRLMIALTRLVERDLVGFDT